MTLSRIPLRWRIWINGLVGASINSITAGSLVVAFSPDHWAAWATALKTGGALAGVGAWLYIKEHKIPDVFEVEVSKVTTTGTGSGTTTIAEVTKTTKTTTGNGDGTLPPAA